MVSLSPWGQSFLSMIYEPIREQLWIDWKRCKRGWSAPSLATNNIKIDSICFGSNLDRVVVQDASSQSLNGYHVHIPFTETLSQESCFFISHAFHSYLSLCIDIGGTLFQCCVLTSGVLTTGTLIPYTDQRYHQQYMAKQMQSRHAR